MWGLHIVEELSGVGTYGSLPSGVLTLAAAMWRGWDRSSDIDRTDLGWWSHGIGSGVDRKEMWGGGETGNLLT